MYRAYRHKRSTALLALLLLIGACTACAGASEGSEAEQIASDKATMEALATAIKAEQAFPPTASDLVPTATSTPTPTITPSAPPPVTPTMTLSAPRPPTPMVPSQSSCQVPVYSGFQSIHGVDWNTLGCPSAAPSTSVLMAKESFEGGQMIWREDYRQIYVRYDSGSWRSFSDSWNEGQPEFSCPDMGTQSPPVPGRGFGKVWCEQSDVREQLGWAKNEEQGFRGIVQDFLTGGHIIQMDTGRIFILYPAGTWVDR